MFITLVAELHLWKDYSENLRSIKNQPKRSLKQLFLATEMLIWDQKEITCIPVIDWQQLIWQRTVLLADKAVQFATAKTYVFFRLSIVYGRNQIPSKPGKGEE